MSMIVYPTVSIVHARPVLQELDLRGYTLERLCADIGLCVPDTEASQSSTEIPIMQFTRLYGHAYRLLEAQTSTRSDHEPMPKEAADMMCYCLINCRDLKEVLERTKIFLEMVKSQGMSMHVSRVRDAVELRLDLNRKGNDTAASLVTLAAINMLHQLYSWLIGIPIQLERVSLSTPKPMLIDKSENTLGVVPQFNQKHNTIIFNHKLLTQPVVRTYAELMEIIDFLQFDLWYCINATNSVSARVRTLLLTAIEREQTLPSMASIAQLHHISEATLRRRLATEGTSYSKIREECQRSFARRFLTSSQCKIESVATRLGFLDDRSFRRAFRRWYGCSPKAFREQQAR